MKYEKYSQIVLESCLEVYEQMSQKQIRGQLKLNDSHEAMNEFTVSIVIPYKNNQENLEGKFVLGLTDKETATMLAAPIAENMGFLPPTEYGEIVSDTLGEYMNTVVGQSVTGWDNLGLTADFTPPFATEGACETEKSTGKKEVYSILLDINHNSVILTISFQESAPALLEGKKVLVVDDSRMIRFHLSKEFTKVGCEVQEAVNGRDAVEKYQASMPDLTIMDLVMPEMGGMDAVANIKKINPHANILVLTSSSTKAQVLSALKLGVKGFIKKPVKIDRLLEAAQKVFPKA